MDIKLPTSIKKLLTRFSDNGYEGYLVGGCVRDSILKRENFDWDITTNATPDQIIELFNDYRTVPTGIKHGTVTVVTDKINVEVTTYRIDGDYKDNRHPEEVIFSRNLTDDLLRRDFTINTLCYNLKEGFVDKLGGLEDLANKIIRAVGEPDKRFNEDALRIMRAIRFAAQLGFTIEEKTKESIFRNKHLLKNISVERLAAELIKLICGEYACEVLSEYGPIIFEFIPELECEYKHKQIGKKHAYDIWNHTCHAIKNIEKDKILRLTMLLHDIGKVPTESFDEDGNSTFKNHAAVGGEIALKVLKRLKLDNKTVDTVSYLVSIHDKRVPLTKIDVKKYLRDTGDENFLRMMKIRKADRGALSDGFNDISQEVQNALSWYAQIKENNECYSLNQLHITGNDLIKIGVTGEKVGDMLNTALDAVIEEVIPNKKKNILDYLEDMLCVK